MSTKSIDVCISFDTTGSMYPCLTQVRRSVAQTVKKLFQDIPDLRISIIAHGDYCDATRYYVTKILDFSRDVNKVTSFVSNVGRTGGGDAPECYELVLYEARTKLNWQSGRSKVIVMIGDDVPHPPHYDLNTLKIDWRNELGLLLEAGINVYGVHAMPGIRSHSKPFYVEIAKTTGGFYLTLDQFSGIVDLIMAICYKQESPKAFEDFVIATQKKGRLTPNLRVSIETMAGDMKGSIILDIPGMSFDEYSYVKDGLNPVPAGRFQVIDVDYETKIRDFIVDQGIEFKKGRAFYELVRHGKKRYKVQQYKEILLMDPESGNFFNGSEVREMLGLLPQCEIVGKNRGEVENLSPKGLDKYRVFIQSTSYTRKLVPGTNLLYEVSDWDM
jgi:hypothetical protein